MSDAEVVSYADQDLLSAACAARLITTLGDVQAARGSASVVLTGGGVGIEVLRGLRRSPAREAIDFGRLDVYWGDERFLAAGDGERNETQAREALLDHVALDPARVHPMAASHGPYRDDAGAAEAAEAAARAYADTLAENAAAGESSPAFDVMLLGLGPEGHTASLFPNTAHLRERDASVLAVHDSPKPPPTRISLSLPAIRHSREVWLIAAGESKADAVALALSGAPETDLPVAGARGTERTLWLLDRAAASRVG